MPAGHDTINRTDRVTGPEGSGGPEPLPGSRPGRLRLLWCKTDHPGIQFLRYVAVGGAGFAVDYSALFLLTEWGGLHYLLSAPPAFLAGMVVHYALSVSWVFCRRSLSHRGAEFLIYASFGILGLGLNEAIIWFLTERFSMHYMVSKPFYLIVYVLLFLARKLLLFR
jgi:putative flippase GtrA